MKILGVVYYSHDDIGIVMDLLKGGNLADFLRAQRKQHEHIENVSPSYRPTPGHAGVSLNMSMGFSHSSHSP